MIVELTTPFSAARKLEKRSTRPKILLHRDFVVEAQHGRIERPKPQLPKPPL
jgi:hypothetical protein